MFHVKHFQKKAIVFDPFPRLRYKAASEGF